MFFGFDNILQPMPRYSKLRRPNNEFLLLSVGLFLVFGCAGTKEAMEKKGIEVDSGKVMKVMRF